MWWWDKKFEGIIEANTKLGEIVRQQSEDLNKQTEEIKRVKVAFNNLNEKFKSQGQNIDEIKKLKIDYIRLLKETKAIPGIAQIKQDILNLARYSSKEVISELENIILFLKGDRIEEIDAIIPKKEPIKEPVKEPVVALPTPIVPIPVTKDTLKKETIETHDIPIIVKEEKNDLYVKLDLILNKILSKEEIDALNL